MPRPKSQPPMRSREPTEDVFQKTTPTKWRPPRDPLIEMQMRKRMKKACHRSDQASSSLAREVGQRATEKRKRHSLAGEQTTAELAPPDVGHRCLAVAVVEAATWAGMRNEEESKMWKSLMNSKASNDLWVERE